MVEEEHGAGGVGLQALRFDVGLEVDDDAFVAEADAEVLQASVPAAGLGEVVVELVSRVTATMWPLEVQVPASRRRARWSSSSTHQHATASLSSTIPPQTARRST